MLKYDEDDANEWRQAVRHAEQERNELRRELELAYAQLDRVREELWEEQEKSAGLVEELRGMGGFRW